MKRVLPSAECPTGQLSFSVLVGYEDFPAATQARKVLEHLRRETGKFEFRHTMWKFNLLQNQKLKNMVTEDAAAADMLIIALHADENLPEEVREVAYPLAGAAGAEGTR